MGMLRQERRRQGGFTLLEMLIALAVLGLLMAGLTQGVHTGLALWSAQMRHIDGTAELDSTARALRDVLSSMQPGARINPAPGSTAAMVGDRNRLSFVGDLPTGLGTSRRAEITIMVQGGRLMLLWRSHGSGLPPAPLAPAELLRGVARLDLSYWRAPAQGSPGAWLAEWPMSGLPNLIRVRLAFAADDSRRWADLIVHPLLWAPPTAADQLGAKSGG